MNCPGCSHSQGRTLEPPCLRPQRSPSPQQQLDTAAPRVGTAKRDSWCNDAECNSLDEMAFLHWRSPLGLGFSSVEKTCDKEFIIRRAATNRVLNVLRHWVSKHSQVSQLQLCQTVRQKTVILWVWVSGLLSRMKDPMYAFFSCTRVCTNVCLYVVICVSSN